MCYNFLMKQSLKKFIKKNYINPKKTKEGGFKFFWFRKRNKTKIMAIDGVCYEYKEDFKADLQETFVQNLFKIIDAKGMKDSEVYKRANIDRKLFSKIRCDINYSPSKGTVLALAVGLKLNLDETKSFLEKAGFALSKSILTDVIVEYYIINNDYDIFKINQVLYDYKLKPLGNF